MGGRARASDIFLGDLLITSSRFGLDRTKNLYTRFHNLGEREKEDKVDGALQVAAS